MTSTDTTGETDEILNRLRAAETALNEGRLEQAEAICHALTGDDRQQAGAANILGVIARRRDDMEGALAQFRIAGDLDNQTAGYFVNQGRTLIALKRPKEAVVPLRRAVALRPHSGEANHNLGNALRLAGDMGGALRHY
ncbi:unnamed protein product [Ectocarpus sp. 8 AP-2014]